MLKVIKKWILVFLVSMFSLIPLQKAPVFAQEEYILTIILERFPKMPEETSASIYRISLGDQAEYSVEENFKSVELDGYDLNEEKDLQQLAEILTSFTEENDLDPLAIVNANEKDQFVFEGLESGMYFVPSIKYESTDNSSVRSEPMVFWVVEDSSVSAIVKEILEAESEDPVYIEFEPDYPDDMDGVSVEDPQLAPVIDTAVSSQQSVYLLSGVSTLIILVGLFVGVGKGRKYETRR